MSGICKREVVSVVRMSCKSGSQQPQVVLSYFLPSPCPDPVGRIILNLCPSPSQRRGIPPPPLTLPSRLPPAPSCDKHMILGVYGRVSLPSFSDGLCAVLYSNQFHQISMLFTWTGKIHKLRAGPS